MVTLQASYSLTSENESEGDEFGFLSSKLHIFITKEDEFDHPLGKFLFYYLRGKYGYPSGNFLSY